MSLTYSQNFLLLNTIRSSTNWEHRLNDLTSFLWPLSSCCLENHFRKNKERGQQGGGHSW